jgi:chemotaxis protein CheZ
MQPSVRRKMFSAEQRLYGLPPSMSAETPPVAADAVMQILQEMAALRAEVRSLSEQVARQPAAALAAETAPAAPAEGAQSQRIIEEEAAMKAEVTRLVQILAGAKREIAAIKHPLADDSRMTRATGELDAITLATETATHDIINAAESIDAMIGKIASACHDDPEVLEMLDHLANATIRIHEACNFQDISGQRIAKVIKTIRFVEERVIAMINLWGVDAFIEVPVETGKDENDQSRLLNGPALANEGLSQADIDALFD